MRGLLLLCAVALLCGACTTTRTVYNITFSPHAFKVSDELTVEPGQGGDATDTSANEAASTGGAEMSPGNTNWIRGFADQGNIFNIGTSTTPTTTTETDAQVDATVTP